MDCEMPVMDGFECTMAIRHYETEKGLKRTPIIALTAHALPINNERCVAAGMDSVLTKPVKFNQLEKLLETIQSDPE
jgi:CheY-like chemotaxis protein